MYIINTIPDGKCFARYLRTLCFGIRNRTSERSERVRFLIRQQLVLKYRTPAFSKKYSLFIKQEKCTVDNMMILIDPVVHYLFKVARLDFLGMIPPNFEH